MAAQPSFSKINLVPQDEFEKSTIGKILRWALTAGKSIVIVTEFVVILAFLSRFKLDRDLNDLNEVINQKVQVVESYAETEKQMRSLQKRALVAREVQASTIGFGDWWRRLSGITPSDTTYDSVDINAERLTLKGLSSSGTSFTQLIEGIKKTEDVEEININKIAFDQSQGGVSFEIAAKLKTTEKK